MSLKSDLDYMKDAVSLASTPPFGTTFPNPPVGCVIVSKDGEVLGEGFHPLAGYPHAEIFALLEASGKVESGRLAAAGVMIEQGVSPDKLSLTPSELSTAVASGNLVTSTLLPSYISSGSSMFTSCAPGSTAYVTLEPCSHFGRTPPCCAALKSAGVSRVVIGQRDPNPKVDGGGVKL
ncbi:hypothetical protein TrRE_jg12145 [Triparma retinervis]|uniref:CMP/dCMP-type deaminase domain-containing protein n=1 Tax=Triparma retinervis TaxID=2557542 RepID=A0A9W7ASF9_9STRA|nr:hypothetical protein TrRE_jg12145 [Triparma retinervis]